MKTALRFQVALTRWLSSGKQMTNAGKTAGEMKLTYTLGCIVTWRGFYGNQRPHDQVTPLLGVYQDSK